MEELTEKAVKYEPFQTDLQQIYSKSDRLLAGYVPITGEIEAFWMEGSNREGGTWREHREINMVILATSLAPDGFWGV